MREKRKNEHVLLAKNQTVLPNRFDHVSLETISIPCFELDDISLSSSFLGHEVPYPIYINAMTGGTKMTHEINMKLARLAEHFQIPFVLGSQSLMAKDKSYAQYFNVRPLFKGILVGNLSANYKASDVCDMRKAIDADAMSIHLNLIQELSMKEGDRTFSSWISNLKEFAKLPFPVLVKETGFGMSTRTVQLLKEMGFKYVDVSGKGGTNFSKIEYSRYQHAEEPLIDLGIETVDAIRNAVKVSNIDIYASGGIRNALDVTKALVLGAKMVGMSHYFLMLLDLSFEEQVERIEALLEGIRSIMMVVGAQSIDQLKNVPYVIG